MRIGSWIAAVVRNRLGRVSRPGWCTYLVTFRCNARCQMCDSWQIDPGKEMTPDDVRAVFAKIGRLDVVRLSGGEPFVRTDMPEIADAIMQTSRPSVLHITTNGSLARRVIPFAEQFAKPRKLRFMVSFDGLAEEHDRNRGKGVSFAKAIETVRELAKLRDKRGIEVSANHTVISKQSMEDNEGLRKQLGEIGVEVHSVLAYADSAMYGLELHGKQADHLIVPMGYPLLPELKEADPEGFVERELADVATYRSGMLRWGKRYYLRGLLSRLRGEPDARPKPKCVALRSHIRLLPDGSVPICQFNTKTVGNLVEQPFAGVWNNGTSEGARDWVDRCPGCWAECEVMPNAIYSGDILRGR